MSTMPTTTRMTERVTAVPNTAHKVVGLVIVFIVSIVT